MTSGLVAPVLGLFPRRSLPVHLRVWNCGRGQGRCKGCWLGLPLLCLDYFGNPSPVYPFVLGFWCDWGRWGSCWLGSPLLFWLWCLCRHPLLFWSSLKCLAAYRPSMVLFCCCGLLIGLVLSHWCQIGIQKRFGYPSPIQINVMNLWFGYPPLMDYNIPQTWSYTRLSKLLWLL